MPGLGVFGVDHGDGQQVAVLPQWQALQAPCGAPRNLGEGPRVRRDAPEVDGRGVAVAQARVEPGREAAEVVVEAGGVVEIEMVHGPSMRDGPPPRFE
jgi:hypothetical protein